MKIRTRRAAESILENEALTADLDDEAAEALIKWGISQSRKIVSRTDGLSDEDAEQAISGPMRALRQMLRSVNKLAASQDPSQLETFLTRASEVYPGDFSISGTYERARFLMQLPKEPSERVEWLRQFVESRLRGA
jgi:hypothetical protein